MMQANDNHKVEWRELLHWDGKAALVAAACVGFLVLLLGVLPTWLRGQDRADFAAAAPRTVPGQVTVCQISPVSSGGGGLYNAVNVEFAGRQAYYALPPTSDWKPIFHQKVQVTYRVGTHSGLVHVDSVKPL